MSRARPVPLAGDDARVRISAPGRRRVYPSGAGLGPLAAVLVVTAAACTSVGQSAPETPSGPPPLVLEAGTPTPADEARARSLVDSARAALAQQRFDVAWTAAWTVVESLPSTSASGQALESAVEAAVGGEDWVSAGEAAGRLAALLPATDPRQDELRRTEARGLFAAGDAVSALELLLARRPVAETGAGADDLERVRDMAASLGREDLESVLAAAAPGHPLAAPVHVAYGTALLLGGEADDARAQGREALAVGATGADAEAARSLTEGMLPPGMATFRIGALLPLTGSPGLRSFAAGVRDGIETAISAAGLDGVVELEVLDTGGDLSTMEALVRAAEGAGVLGIVGPLQDDALLAAARARAQGVTLVSPTAPSLPQDAGEGVFSLGAADPGAPAALAAWAVRAGIREVAIVHASRGPSADEARLFEQRFRQEGGRVARTFVYEPGATFFQEQLRAVHALRPQALFLPAPPEDVQALAPQVSFFGLDTLGVQVLGTSGWADAATMAAVGRRHLDGVVAVAPRVPTDTEVGRQRFVSAYETRFRRTLVDPGAPSLGYDAAALLLQAVRAGARSPDALRRGLESVDGFAGATGVLSFDGGLLVREHRVVCLWAGEAVELDPTERPEPAYRPYVADPETGEVPEGPGRPAGFRCPGVEPIDPPPGA